MAEKIHEKGGSLAPIYDRLSTAGNYHPYSAETFSDWSLESGDVITLYKEGTAYQSPVYTSRMVWRGAPETTLTTTGNQEREAVAKLGNRKYGGGGGGYRNTDLLDTRFTQNQEMILMEAWDRQDQYKQFYSNFQVTAKKISAVVTKTNENSEILKQAGFELTADGFLVYAVDATKPNYLSSKFQVLADMIGGEISRATGEEASLWLTLSSLTSRISDAEGNISTLIQTASSLTSRISDAEGNISTLIQTASSLTSRISDAEGNISTIIQTASSITSRISDAEGNISTLIQTASSLTSRITDAEGNISVLIQTASSLTSRISDTEGNVSALIQTASSLTSRINDAEGNISTLVQTASSITSRITDVEGNISTLVQTASSLTSRISDTEGNVSTLVQTASSLSSRIDDAEGNISSLEQTASSLTSRISTAEGYYSTITQTAQEVQSKVSAGDIASTINQTAQSVLISAEKINLEGYVTATELQATNANITNLTNGTTQASHLDGSLVTGTTVTARNTFVYGSDTISKRTLKIGDVSSLTVLATGGATTVDFDHSHRVSMAENVSNGTVTITIHEAQSTEGTANFSIAATETYKGAAAAGASNVNLSGAWSGNVFTVTATNGKTRDETLTAGTGTGNQSVGGQYTISTFNSSHKAYGYVNASSLTGSRLFTFNVDATSVYEEGAATASVGNLVLSSYSGATFQARQYASDNSTLLASTNGQVYLDESAGSYTRSCWACVRPTGGSRIAYIALADYWDAAQAAVTPTATSHLKKGSWSAGQLSITKTSDSGYPDSVSVQLTLSGSWGSGTDANKYTYTVYDDRTSTGLTGIITAPSTSQRTADGITAGTGLTVDSTGKILSGTASVFYDDGTYTSGVSLQVNATKAYEAGWIAGYNAAAGVSGKTSTGSIKVPTTTSTYDSKPTATYRGYDEGWNDCVDATSATGRTYLENYTNWKPGAMRALYEFDGVVYTKATGTNQYWRYGGNTTTKYSLQDKIGD